MASIRELKKDIDYLIYEVISDCFVFSELHPENKSDELSAVITDAVELRNDLISRVNNPDRKADSKLIKTYYKTLQKDMLTGVDKLFNRLSELSKK